MTLVLFGAGNIGRSFIAPVFSQSGYEVIFVDINKRVISELNRLGEYSVVTVAPDGTQSQTRITGVRAITARDTEAVATAVAAADLAATAVGAAGFGAVCDLIARGSSLRSVLRPGVPLDIILAENIPGAAALARNHMQSVPGLEAGMLGLVETSIGKMVPIVPELVSAADPLIVYAEPYNTLIVDREGFAGAVPKSPDVKAVSNIRAYVDRKLFIHNLGHAAIAYLGYAHAPGASKVAQAIQIPGVREAAMKAMRQSAEGLFATYPGEFDRGDLDEHIEDLLIRFANPALGDTVFRVGRDLGRKLGPSDRIIGAMQLLAALDLPMDSIAAVYVAALAFEARDETGAPCPGDPEVIDRYRGSGLGSVLESISGLDRGTRNDRVVWDAISVQVDQSTG